MRNANADANGSATNDRARRMRLVWLSLLANLTVVVALIVLWYQGSLTGEVAVVLGLVVLLIVNAASILGWRIGRRRGSAKPWFFFLIGAFAAILAVVEIASHDYGSAGMLLLSCVSVVGLGIIGIRNDAKKSVGQLPNAEREE